MANIDRETYLEQFKKDPQQLMGHRVLPQGRIVKSQRKFRTPEEMQYHIDLYFERCIDREEHPTVPALALALGFPTTAAFAKYETEHADFNHVAQTARTRIEAYKNQMLLKGGTTTDAVKFDLKNQHRWADRTETHNTMEVGNTLADLVKSLQGRVLRPSISPLENVEYRKIENLEDEI